MEVLMNELTAIRRHSAFILVRWSFAGCFVLACFALACFVIACSSGTPNESVEKKVDVATSAEGMSTPAKPPPRRPSSRPKLVAIDVYGSAHLDREAILTLHGDEIRAYWSARSVDRKQRRTAIEEKLVAHPQITSADLSAITYSDGDKERKTYLTVDLVDTTDVEERMVFRPRPSGEFADPDGLIAAAQRYSRTYNEMLRSGEISRQWFDCPVWHCLGDYSHPRLAKLIAPVVAGAETNKSKLQAILFGHRDPVIRATAAVTIGHIRDGGEVVEIMLKAMQDSESRVRNDAIRVLIDIASLRPEIPIPAAPLIRAIHSPTTIDRNKALAVLFYLLERPSSRATIELIRSDGVAVSRLRELLELQQPNNHDFAYMILKKLSGKEYGERDYDSWRSWAHSLRKLDSSNGPR